MRRIILVLAASLVSLAVGATAQTQTVADFVARHWRAPLPPQGSPPATFSPLEASLAPEACGSCHPTQLADWRTSLHSRTMGPGVSGQLVGMHREAPGDALGCYTCHAPLAEQRPFLSARDGHAKNPVYDPALASHGLVCAACHVRAHERFGPPRRDGSLASAGPRESLPHRGVTRTRAFVSSEFCRGCHQFERGGLSLNGKLVQNTYEEWKASRFARDGVHCQDCHMPDRRHLWRGIHDPDMVRSGLTITTTPDRAAPANGLLQATLRVRSTRIGHAFPTYVIPRVILRGEQIDADGRAIAGTRQDYVIGREVTLDLEKELRDTRLMPGQTASLAYRMRAAASTARLRLSVIVEPDAFYVRFFQALVEQEDGAGLGQLREALATTSNSPFVLFTRDVPVEARRAHASPAQRDRDEPREDAGGAGEATPRGALAEQHDAGDRRHHDAYLARGDDVRERRERHRAEDAEI